MRKRWEDQRTAEEMLYNGFVDLYKLSEAKEMFARSAAKGNEDAASFVALFDKFPEVSNSGALLEMLKREPPGRLTLAAIGRLLHAHRKDEEAEMVLRRAVEYGFLHAFGFLGTVIPLYGEIIPLYGETEKFWIWREGIKRGDPWSMQRLAHYVDTKEEKKRLLIMAAEKGEDRGAYYLLREFAEDADAGTLVHWLELYVAFGRPAPVRIEDYISSYIEGSQSQHPSDDDLWVKYQIGKICMRHYVGTEDWKPTVFLESAVMFYDNMSLQVKTVLYYSVWMLQKEFRFPRDVALKTGRDIWSSRDDVNWVIKGHSK